MTTTQRNFIRDHLEQRQGSSLRKRPYRRHLICYLMPWWMRDGYEDEPRGMIGHFGAPLVRLIAKNPNHPRQEVVIEAVKLLNA